VTAIRLGPSALKDDYVTDPLAAIFSTSTTITLVPEFIAEDFFSRILVGVTHKVL